MEWHRLGSSWWALSQHHCGTANVEGQMWHSTNGAHDFSAGFRSLEGVIPFNGDERRPWRAFSLVPSIVSKARGRNPGICTNTIVAQRAWHR